ncbi:hypothetical protein HK405_005482, partial [Cladochytrium tenue]
MLNITAIPTAGSLPITAPSKSRRHGRGGGGGPAAHGSRRGGHQQPPSGPKPLTPPAASPQLHTLPPADTTPLFCTATDSLQPSPPRVSAVIDIAPNGASSPIAPLDPTTADPNADQPSPSTSSPLPQSPALELKSASCLASVVALPSPHLTTPGAQSAGLLSHQSLPLSSAPADAPHAGPNEPAEGCAPAADHELEPPAVFASAASPHSSALGMSSPNGHPAPGAVGSSPRVAPPVHLLGGVDPTRVSFDGDLLSSISRQASSPNGVGASKDGVLGHTDVARLARYEKSFPEVVRLFEALTKKCHQIEDIIRVSTPLENGIQTNHDLEDLFLFMQSANIRYQESSTELESLRKKLAEMHELRQLEAEAKANMFETLSAQISDRDLEIASLKEVRLGSGMPNGHVSSSDAFCDSKGHSTPSLVLDRIRSDLEALYSQSHGDEVVALGHFALQLAGDRNYPSAQAGVTEKERLNFLEATVGEIAQAVNVPFPSDDDDLPTLASAIFEMRSRLEDLNDGLSAATARTEELTATGERHVRDLERGLEESRATIREMEQDFLRASEDTRKEIVRLLAENDELAKNLEAANEMLAHYSDAEPLPKDTLARLREREAEIEGYKEEIESLKAGTQQLQESVASLQVQNSAVSQENQLLSGSLSDAEERLSLLQGAFAASEREVEASSAEFEKLKIAFDEAVADVKSLRETNRVLVDERAEADEERGALRLALEQAKRTSAELSASRLGEASALEAALVKERAASASRVALLERTEKERSRLAESLEKEVERASALEVALVSAENRLDADSTSEIALRAQSQDLENGLSKLRGEYINLLEVNSGLVSALSHHALATTESWLASSTKSVVQSRSLEPSTSTCGGDEPVRQELELNRIQAAEVEAGYRATMSSLAHNTMAAAARESAIRNELEIARSELAETKAGLKATIAALAVGASDAAAQLENAKAEVGRLSSELLALRNSDDALLRERDAELALLRPEIVSLQMQLEAATEATKQAAGATNSIVAELARRIECAESELAAQQTAGAELSRKLRESEGALDSFSAEARASQAKSEEEIRRLTLAESASKQLSEKAEKLAKELDSEAERVVYLETKLSTATRAAADSQAERDALQRKLTAQKELLEQAHHNTHGKDEQIVALSAASRRFDDLETKLRGQIVRISKGMSETMTALAEDDELLKLNIPESSGVSSPGEDDLTRLTDFSVTAFDTMTGIVGQLRSRARQLHARNRGLAESQGSVKARSDELERTAEALRKERDALAEQHGSCEAALVSSANDLAAALLLSSTLETDRTALSARLKSVTSSCEVLQTATRVATQERDEALARICDCETKLARSMDEASEAASAAARAVAAERSLHLEAESLRAAHAEAEADARRLRAELDAAATQRDQLARDREAAAQDIASLRADLGHLRAKYKAVSDEELALRASAAEREATAARSRDAARAEIDAATAARADAEAKLAAVADELAAAVSAHVDAEAKLAATAAELEAASVALAAHREADSDREARLMASADRDLRLQTELSDAACALREAQSQRDAAIAEGERKAADAEKEHTAAIKDLLCRLEDSEQRLADAVARADLLASAIEEERRSSAVLITDVDAAGEKLAAAVAIAEENQRRLDAISTERDLLLSQLNESERAAGEAATAAAELINAKEQLDAISAELAAALEERGKLLGSFDAQTAQTAATAATLDSLKAQLQDTQVQLSDALRDLDVVAQRAGDNDGRIVAITTERDGLRSSLDVEVKLHGQARAEVERLQIELEEVGARAAATREALLQSFAAEKDELKSSLDVEAKLHGQARAEVQRLQTELEEVCARAAAEREALMVSFAAEKKNIQELLDAEVKLHEQIRVEAGRLLSELQKHEALLQPLTAERDELKCSLDAEVNLHGNARAELERLQEKLGELGAQANTEREVLLQSFTAEKNELKESLEAKTKLHEQARAELERLQAELDETLTGSKAASEQIEALKRDVAVVESLRRELDGLTDSHAKARDLESRLEAEVSLREQAHLDGEQLREELRESSARLDEALVTITTLQDDAKVAAELKEKFAEFDSLSVKLAESNARLGECRGELDSTSAKVSELESQLEAANANIASLVEHQDSLTAKASRVAELEERIAVEQQDRESLASELNSANLRLKLAEKEAEEVKAQVAPLREQLRRLRDDNEALERQRGDRSRQLDDLARELHSAQMLVSTLEHSATEAGARALAAEQGLATTKQSVFDLSEEVQEHTAALALLRKQLADEEERKAKGLQLLRAAKSRISKLEESLTQREDEATTLRSQLADVRRDAEVALRDKESELARHIQEVVDLTNRLKQQRDEVDDMEHLKNEKENELENLQFKFKDVSMQLTRMTVERDNLRQSMRQVDEQKKVEVESSKSIITMQATQLSAWPARVTELEARIGILDDELAAARQQLEARAVEAEGLKLRAAELERSTYESEQAAQDATDQLRSRTDEVAAFRRELAAVGPAVRRAEDAARAAEDARRAADAALAAAAASAAEERERADSLMRELDALRRSEASLTAKVHAAEADVAKKEKHLQEFKSLLAKSAEEFKTRELQLREANEQELKKRTSRGSVASEATSPPPGPSTSALSQRASLPDLKRSPGPAVDSSMAAASMSQEQQQQQKLPGAPSMTREPSSARGTLRHAASSSALQPKRIQMQTAAAVEPNIEYLRNVFVKFACEARRENK